MDKPLDEGVKIKVCRVLLMRKCEHLQTFWNTVKVQNIDLLYIISKQCSSHLKETEVNHSFCLASRFDG